MCVSIRSSSFSFDRCSHSLFIHVCCVAQGQSHSDGFALLFTAIARLVKAAGLIAVAAAIGDSEWEQIKTWCRHTCLHRTQSSSHEVAQLHEHSETGQSATTAEQMQSNKQHELQVLGARIVALETQIELSKLRKREAH